MNKYIPYSRQLVEDDDIKAVLGVLRSDYLTQGPKIREFDDALADYTGARYAVAFSSGTAALHAAYFAAGLNKGDEIITSPITFAATANAALYLGARPVFADIELDTGNINTEHIKNHLTERTRLIVPVHYAGHPVDLDYIHKMAKEQNLVIIEDACHAPGAGYNPPTSPLEKGGKGGLLDRGKNGWIRMGSCIYSDMTVFSFHPVKHITTGEGGAVVTNNEEHHKKLLMFRTHGITKKDLVNEPDGDWFYEMQFPGYNYRMTDIQAALGISQLKKLERFVKKRREIARTYNNAFKGNSYFDIPVERDYAFSSYHIYPIRLKDEYKNMKKEIFSGLREKGLGVQVHYIPVYLHPYYRNLGYRKGLCPVAEDFYQREMSLPLYPGMTDYDIRNAIEILLENFNKTTIYIT